MSPDVKRAYAVDRAAVVRRLSPIIGLYDLHYGSMWRCLMIRLWLWWRGA